MTDLGVILYGEDDQVIDYEHLFDIGLHGNNLDFCDVAPSSLPDPNFTPNPNPTPSLSIGEIEKFLFIDDLEEEQPNNHTTDAFLSDVFLDPPPLSSSPDLEEPDSSPFSSSPNSHNHSHEDSSSQFGVHLDSTSPIEEPQYKDKGILVNHPEDNHVVDDDVLGGNDIAAKKRKRQLRNRDAAVRSRERKKMYVKDLEMKSRFYEAECRRLGMLLQCYLAENHGLRYSLYNNNNNGQAYGALTTKQESAVLLLELLLLGSLLWFLGIVGLLNLPRQFLLILKATPLENVGGKNQASLAPRREEVNVISWFPTLQSFMMSKRYRGSRTRIKVFYR